MSSTISSIIKIANMKSSEARSKALAEATMMTMTFPKATVRSQAACTTDFMDSGAWLYENSRPVILIMISLAVRTKYCGMIHKMWTLLGTVRT